MRTRIPAALAALALATTVTAIAAAAPASAGLPGITLQAGFDVVGNNCVDSEPFKTVPAGTEVEVCFTVESTHAGYDNLVVGLDMTTQIFDGAPTFPQSGSGGAFVPSPGFTTISVRAVATDDDFEFQDDDTTFITVLVNPLGLVKTVGAEPGVCATTDTVEVVQGTTVHYCYTATNAFTDRPLEVVYLADDKNPAVDLTDLPSTSIAPGGSVQTIVAQEIFASDSNLATVCAFDRQPRLIAAQVPEPCVEAFVATDTASVTAVPPAPLISLVTTVGTDPASCAPDDNVTVPAGTTVHFCHTVTNDGNVALTSHDLSDTVSGTLLSGFSFALAPGASVDSVTAGVTSSTVATTDLTNTATWTASAELPDPPNGTAAAVTVTATATATAGVTVQVPPPTPTPTPTPTPDPNVGDIGATPTVAPTVVPKKVPAPAKKLAFTGAESGVLAIVGVSLVLGGALVLHTARRRSD